VALSAGRRKRLKAERYFWIVSEKNGPVDANRKKKALGLLRIAMHCGVPLLTILSAVIGMLSALSPAIPNAGDPG